MDKHEPLSLSRKRRIREVSEAYADCLQDSLSVCSTVELKQFAKKLGVKFGNMAVEDRTGFIKVIVQVSVFPWSLLLWIFCQFSIIGTACTVGFYSRCLLV